MLYISVLKYREGKVPTQMGITKKKALKYISIWGELERYKGRYIDRFKTLLRVF